MLPSEIPTALRELVDVARSIQDAQFSSPWNGEEWSLPSKPAQRNQPVYWMRNKALLEPHSSTTLPDASSQGSQQPAVRDAEGAGRNGEGASTSGSRLAHLLRSAALVAEPVRKKKTPTRYYCAQLDSIVLYDVRTPLPPGRTMMHGAHVRRLRGEPDGLLFDGTTPTTPLRGNIPETQAAATQRPQRENNEGARLDDAWNENVWIIPPTQSQAHRPQFVVQNRVSVPLAQLRATTAQRGQTIRFRQSFALITNGTEQAMPPRSNVRETRESQMQRSHHGNAEDAQLDDPWNEDTSLIPASHSQAHPPQFVVQSRISVPLAQLRATTAQRGQAIRFRQSFALITNGTEQTTPSRGNIPETQESETQRSQRENDEGAQLDDAWNENVWIIPPGQSQAHRPQFELQSQISVPLAHQNQTTAQRSRVNRFRQSAALITA